MYTTYYSLPCGHTACQACIFVNEGASFCSKCGIPTAGVPRYELCLRGVALAVLDFWGASVPHRADWFNPNTATWVKPPAQDVGGEPGPSCSGA